MPVFEAFDGLLLGVVRLWPLLLVGAVAVLVLRTRSSRAPTPLPAGAALPSGSWRARLAPMGEIALAPGHGLLRLHDGWLDFVPDDAREPAWVVRCTDVIAAKHSAVAFTDLRLWTPATGGMKVTLSRGRGRWGPRLSGPGEQDLPRPTRSDPSELLWLLGRSGARVG